ncbi:MAG: PDZ domain-containing protein [Myxococcales bacterium]|nr:MAG: PDZ domain-containing protein [Myxococcales bacterium]
MPVTRTLLGCLFVAVLQCASLSCAHEDWRGGIQAKLLYSQQKGLRVAEVPPNSAAARGGLQVQDQILSIDAQSVEGWPLVQVLDKLRGSVGSTIRLGIRRDSKRLTLEVERAPYK